MEGSGRFVKFVFCLFSEKARVLPHAASRTILCIVDERSTPLSVRHFVFSEKLAQSSEGQLRLEKKHRWHGILPNQISW